ncbi:MAG: DUF2274 domain-containing protein [Pararhodobacter sp.]|nr:DUF2274 domain-containing protein [Pararhodobacter sp.]
MTKLKLGPLADDKPAKLTVDLPATLHRDLIAYGEILGREAGQPPTPPARLIVPMLERFRYHRSPRRPYGLLPVSWTAGQACIARASNSMGLMSPSFECRLRGL